MKAYLVAVVALFCCVVVVCASKPSSTPSPVAQDCANRTDCGTCTKSAKCLWCSTSTPPCLAYPGGQIIPHKSVCDLNDARWGVCWVNYKVLLIVMGVLAGVIIISLSCCIYCCCCRGRKNRDSSIREEARYDREREERQTRHTERRAERQTKYDDIRRKYGLTNNSDGSYRRFENEA